MRCVSGFSRTAAPGALAAAALMTGATGALAGGFEVREQSAYFQGMSFAGSAAGGSLSSMFWNPAAAGEAGAGLTTSSSYTLILPDSEITTESVSAPGGVPAFIAGQLQDNDPTVEIGKDALVPASYAAWRYDAKTVFALSINSQFGLGTEPDNPNWAGQFHSRTAQLFSVNATPTVAYEIAPGVTVAGGVQFQYIDLKRLKSAAALDGPSATLEGDDELGVGFTAGLMWKPVPGTSIGVGFRSSIEHDLEGSVNAPGFSAPIGADLELPEKVTLSLRQALAPNMRVLGTVEWTNWSRLDVVPITLDANGVAVANLDFQWHDGWFFALGAEYDYSPKVTLRTGLAYEISPIQNASERLLQLPDADRWWASVGATYRYNEMFTFEFGYTHIFVEDADIERFPASTDPNVSTLLFTGSAEFSVDIISVGMTTKW